MLLFYIIYFMLMPTFAYAYLDPGTGSLLLYAIIGIATSLLFALKSFFYNLGSLFSKGKIKKYTNEKFTIVFHSEGGKYFHIFKPVIEDLISRKISSTYITPDAKDPAFQMQNEYFNVINPGNELVTITFMNNIHADVVVSTTPHFDIYMWKRSKNAKHYAHLFHAPTGVDFYEKYALSFYDSILSVGPFTKIGQDALDRKRNLPEKKYYETGLTYYDYMQKEYDSYTEKSNGKTVLYAPTWGTERSSFFSCGQKIMRTLLENGYDVIFRPHPQFFVSHIKEYNQFKKEFEKFSNLKIDTNRTPVESMIKSDMLITDFSGVLFDYAYLSEKPVFLLNVENATGGYEAEELIPLNADFDISASCTIARKLTEEETENILTTVKNSIDNTNTNKESIRDFKSKNIYNFGNAGKAAADAIIDIQKSLSKEAE